MLNKKLPIDQLVIEIQNNCKQNPKLQNTIKLELDKLVRKLFADAIGQYTGWCMTFKIPHGPVLNLYSLIGVDKAKLHSACLYQWKHPSDAHMLNDAYYQILILLTLYGVREHKEDIISKNAMVLLLAKIWNGRKKKYIEFCNPDVMRYVVANMSRKYLAKKYDNPMSVIVNHFAPTIIKKYGPIINADSSRTKRLFEQSWNRIRQVFISDMAPNIKTGKPEGRSGLAPLYHKYKDLDCKISAPKPGAILKDDGTLQSIDQYTSHNYDQMIGEILNYIIMGLNHTYDDAFIRFVNRKANTKAETIKILLNSIHSTRYNDYIQDILELMFSQLQIGERGDICGPNFYDIVKRRIISSKHSPNVTQLKKIVDLLLERIFDDKVQYKAYGEYSTPNRNRLRKIIFYGFAYNIRKYACSGRG